MSIIWNTATRFELGRRYFHWKEQILTPKQQAAIEVCIFIAALLTGTAIVVALFYVL